MTTALQREVATYKGPLPECPYCHKGLCRLEGSYTEVFRVCPICGGVSGMSRGAFRKYVRRMEGQRADRDPVALTKNE